MNRKQITAMAAGIGLSATAFAAPTVAFAKSDNAAEIVSGAECGGFVPDGNGGMASTLTTEKGHHRVVTKSGNIILSCQFDIPDGQEPSQAISAQGFDCTADGQLTTDSKMLATPGGRAILVCKVKG